MENLRVIEIALLINYYLQAFINSFFCYHVLTPKYSFRTTVPVSSVLFFLCSFVMYWKFSNNIFLGLFFYAIVYLALCTVFYHHSWKVELFLLASILALTYVIHLSATFLLYDILFPERPDALAEVFLLHENILFDGFYFVTVHAFLLWWKKTREHIFQKSIFLTLLFPVSQIFLLESVLYYVTVKAVNGEAYLFPILCILAGIVLSICADMIMFHVILSNSHKERLAAQLEVMQQQAYRELEYYRSVNEKILQMRKIRHDFNNQLQTAYGIFLKDTEESRKNAFEFLDQMQHRMGEGSFSSYYCSNGIVNVILDEKARKSKETGIAFKADVTLPEELPIEMVDLCSIFSNLLDNAIESASLQTHSTSDPHIADAAETTEESGTEPFTEPGKVSVLSYLRSGYCVVKVANSFSENLSASSKPRKDPELHGYGLPILRSIAEKYHGEFTTLSENGIFTATMNLNIDKLPKASHS
ncbi:MAG: GHKL domain-containing protein [Lachnospiraceae bacterium]|nr:GHKL domain-containing protein [Lachnospiraceae bacterium]